MYNWTNSTMDQSVGCVYRTKYFAVLLVLIILATMIVCIREYYVKAIIGITRWHFILIESKMSVVCAYKSFIEDYDISLHKIHYHMPLHTEVFQPMD